MAGGPATIYGPRAYAAFCEFHDAAHSHDAEHSQAPAEAGNPTEQ
jgi:hypothetical protein